MTDHEVVDALNVNGQLEERVLRRLDELIGMDVNPHWLAIAREDIEKGFMALNRAVLNPQRISLDEDHEDG